MPVINADLPAVQFVPVASIGVGGSFRIGSDYFTKLDATVVGGYYKCAKLGEEVQSNILATSEVESVRVDSCDVTISPA